MEKVKVKFIEDCVVDDFRKGTKAEESFKAGKTYTMVHSSAMHWVSRGKAELVG